MRIRAPFPRNILLESPGAGAWNFTCAACRLLGPPAQQHSTSTGKGEVRRAPGVGTRTHGRVNCGGLDPPRPWKRATPPRATARPPRRLVSSVGQRSERAGALGGPRRENPLVGSAQPPRPKSKAGTDRSTRIYTTIDRFSASPSMDGLRNGGGADACRRPGMMLADPAIDATPPLVTLGWHVLQWWYICPGIALHTSRTVLLHARLHGLRKP